MPIATQNSARSDAGRAGARESEELTEPPARLLDLLVSPSGDPAAWRDALLDECLRALAPPREQESKSAGWSAYWLHACATGSAAARIAERTSAADGRIAFAAGLLHDAGKLLLARRFPRSYARAIEIAAERAEPILRAETRLFGTDHTLAGRRLAEDWCLPRSIVDSVWLHHQPVDSLPDRPTRDLIMVVVIADSLSRHRWPGWGSAFDASEQSECAGRLGMSAAALDEIRRDIAGDVSRLARRLEGQAPPTADDALRERVHSALAGMSRSICPGSNLAELCAIASQAAVSALEIEGACIVSAAEGSDLLEIGAATPAGRRCDRLPLISDGSPLLEIATLRVCGATFFPIPPQCAAILDRFCGRSGGTCGWALPLLAGSRVVGALLLRAGASRVRELAAPSSPYAVLLGILPALLGPAVAAVDAVARGDDLAQGARRLGEARAEAAQARTGAAMAEFASGAAHELNTPLAVIAGRAEQLLAWELDPELERGVSAIRENARRCAEIVNELAALSDPAPPDASAVDVRSVVNSIRDASIGSGDFGAAECCVEISDDLPPVVVDENHLRIMLQELLINAVEATLGRERRLAIKAARDRTDEQVVISVADNGRGMEPEVRERAFDPFFSRRPAGRGRGLGLARVRRLAALNGGRVRIRSEIELGTVVDLMLPMGGNGD